MIEIGDQIQQGSFPEDVVALTGISHLAGTHIARRMGFEVEDLNVIKRLAVTQHAVQSYRAKNLGTIGIQDYKNKWHKSHRVWISTDDIVNNQALYRELLNKYSYHPRRRQHSSTFIPGRNYFNDNSECFF